MERKGTAQWEGDLKNGKGTLQLGSGAFQGAYSFATRFESAPGTNPEELIAAAHAACFSMAFSGALGASGHLPTRIETQATVRLEKGTTGFGITHIQLDCTADVPGVAPDELQRIADDAKANCPVSKALAAVPIELRLNR
jgi:osmotically inducible protein OsmC